MSETRRSWAPRRFPEDSEAREVISEWLRSDAWPSISVTGMNFSGSDLSEIKISGGYLYSCDFSNSILIGADIYRSDLSGSVFSASDLRGAELVRVDCGDVDFGDARLVESVITNTSFYGSNMRGANLGSRCMNDCSFSCVELEDVVFDDAEFNGVTLPERIGRSVSFSGTHGSVYGPPSIEVSGVSVPMSHADMERWFADQGAAICFLNGANR